MPRGWNQERREAQLQRGVGVPPPLPWPDHLQRPDFFHRPTEHRAPALNHHLLAMEQLPPSLNERLPMMVDHRPYDHRSMLGDDDDGDYDDGDDDGDDDGGTSTILPSTFYRNWTPPA